MDMERCITWKNAFFGLAALTTVFAGHVAWAETRYANADDVKEVKQILVKCLIEKKC